jgi:hypothetical protein
MCVNPLKGFVNKNGYVVKVSRNAKYIIRRNNTSDWLSRYDDPSNIDNNNNDNISTKYIDIPCRRCPECQSVIKREWTCRAIAEAQVHNKMCFITLTYDNANIKYVKTVDEDGVVYKHATLDHKDFQLFMYRLRNHFPDRKIRFFMAGEYGDRTFRPHYHAILYGVSIDDFSDLRVQTRNKDGDLLYKSDFFAFNLWQLGFCLLAECTSATIGYVAGYVDKKYIKGAEFYRLTGIVPPYVRSSNRPGLGVPWFVDNIDKFKDLYDYVSVPNGLSDPTKIYLTETWKKKYENNVLQDADLYDILMADDKKVVRRMKFSDALLDLERSGSDRSKDEYLKEKGRYIQKRKDMKVRDF